MKHAMIQRARTRFSRFGPFVALSLMLALAALLNFHALDRTSLWNDEAFSFFAAQSGLSHTLRFIADDTQPPFYYLSLSLWLHLGASVFAIRALSATAMTIALLPLYAAARRLFGHHVALLASFLFAIAPLNLAWAQKARPYPLQAMLVAFTFWAFVRIFLATEARQQLVGAGMRQAFRQRTLRPLSIDLAWITYALCGALAMLAQDPAGFFLLGCNCAMAIVIFGNLRRHRILLANWVIVQLLLILIWAMWLPTFLTQIAAHFTADQIATKHAVFLVGFSAVVATIGRLLSISSLWSLASLYVPIYAVLGGFAVYRLMTRHRGISPVLATIFIPIAVCVVGFFSIHALFGYVIYTFVWIMVPYTILIAFGILAIRSVPARLLVLGIVVLGNAWGLKNAYQTETPPLDRVAALIRADLLPEDAIVLSDKSSGRWGLSYYLGSPYGITPMGLRIDQWGGETLVHSVSELAGRPRVWVVVPIGEPPAVALQSIKQRRPMAFTEQVGQFQIYRFDACGKPAGCGPTADWSQEQGLISDYRTVRSPL
jgi:uncharacterized membrane protein